MARRPEEIGLNAPTEAIDVPRSTTYAPVEFSGQIAATQEGRSSLAEIPKAAAGIVLAHNEYKRTEKEGDIALDDTADALAQKDLEETFKLSENNRIQAKSMEMLDTMDRRRKEALADPNGSLAIATKEVFEEYEMPDEFLNSPYAMSQWQHMHNNYQKDLVPKAFTKDRERETARAKFNWEHQLGIATGMIHTGSSVEDAYKHLMAQMLTYRGSIDDQELQEFLNRAGQSLLVSKLQTINTQAKAENWSEDKINATLKEFRETYKEMQFAWTNEDGTPVLENGQPATLNLVMSAQTHDQIESVYRGLVVGAASKSKANVAVDIGSIDKDIDWDQFKKTGYSNWLRRTDLANIPSQMNSYLSEIDAGGGSVDTKATKKRAVVERFCSMYLAKSIADAINAGGMTTSNIAQFANKLNMDINHGGYQGEWADYTCQIKVGDQTLTISLPEEMKQHLVNDKQAAIFWKNALGHITRFSQSGSKTANFLSATEFTYGQVEAEIASQFIVDTQTGKKFADKFTETLGEGKYKGVGEDELTAHFIKLSQTSEGLGAGQQGLSDNLQNVIMKTLTDIEDPRQRLAAASVVAGALRKSGYAGQFLLSLSQKNGTKGYTKATDAPIMIQAAMFLDKEGIDYLDDAIAKGLDVDEMASVYQTGDANKTNSGKTITVLLNRNNIPSSMYNTLFFVGSVINKSLAQNAVTGSDQKHQTNLEKRMQSIIDDNFYTFSSKTHMKNKVYKYSRQMYNQNLERLDKTMVSTVDVLGKHFDAKYISFKVNEETGDFDITFADRVVSGIASDGSSVPVASILTEYTREGKTDNLGQPIDPKKIGTYVAVQAYTGIMATDSFSAQQIYDMRRKKNALQTVDEKVRAEVMKRSPFAGAIALGRFGKAVFDHMRGKEPELTEEEKALNNIPAVRKQAMMFSNVLCRQEIADIYLTTHQDPSAWVMPGRKTLVKNINAEHMTHDLKYAPEELYRQFAPDADVVDVLHWTEQFITHAEKASQGNASLPMSAAAANENYYDQQSAAKTAGYEISGVEMDGIANTDPIEDEDDEEDFGVPTGMAAPITSKKTEYTKADLENRAKKAADKYQIPRSLMNALVVQESGYRVDAKSKAGASGLMQLMPATAKSLGVTDIFDVDQNIDAGARYLQQQYKRFGSWPLALAAYNAGPGAVEDYKNGTNFTGGNPNKRKTGGIPNYPETQNYVKNIMTKSGLNKNTYGITFGLANNKARFIDSDMGMLSVNGVSRFLDMLNGTKAYKGQIESISTNRRELLEDKPEYRDFAKFRAMRTEEGKPLFVAGDTDGFRVNLRRQGTGTLNPAAITALAEDAVNNQSDRFDPVSHETARTLLRVFDNRYDYNKSKEEPFGLANLSIEEYNNYGIPLTCLDNPLLQNRVLVHEFQRATDLLGSERKAIFALAGGDLRTPEGEIKSWKEIKSDDMAYEKEWYIAPSADDKRRNTINEVLAMFDKLRNYATKEA
jgi:soluble lytic murein transglycosylase-like protein